MQPVLLSALRQIFVKLCVAVIFAGTVASASNSSLALGLRYFAAVSLLISLALAGMAIFQRNAAQGPLSNWNEATIFFGNSGYRSLIRAAEFLTHLVIRCTFASRLLKM